MESDYRPITKKSENKLADLWKTVTETRIPLGDYEYGLGVKVNDVLRPVTDTRAGPDMLPKDFSLEEVPGFLAHMAEGYDVKKMGQGILDAIENGPNPDEPYGAIKHLFRLLPLLGVIGESVPFAPRQVPGSKTLGTYVGRASRTADLAALERAETMERAGHSAAPGGDIRPATGWFREPGGGEWQYEISDERMRLKDPNSLSWGATEDLKAGNTTFERAGDVVDHPDLFAAHPELADTTIKLTPGGNPSSGYFDPESNTVGLSVNRNRMPGEDPTLEFTPEHRRTALHELGGHAVQESSGFAKGANPENLPSQVDPKVVSQTLNLADAYEKAYFLNRYPGDKRFQDRYDRLPTAQERELARLDRSELEGMHDNLRRQAEAHMTENSSFGQYRRHLGEYAARDIEARADLNDWARQDIPPYSSEPTPQAGWIDSRGPGGGKAMSVDPPGPEGEPPVAPISLDEVVAPTGTPGAGAGADGIGDIADPSPGGRPADPVKDGNLAPAPPPPFKAPPKPKFKAVKFKGKLLSEWTDKDFEAYGKQFGVDNLGPESPPHMIKDMDGNEFNIPGGLEGNFTYFDLLKIKSQAINADRLEPALHTELAAKLGRTMTPANLTVEQIFNGMLFGITSPNQPLLPNQMAASRLKVGSMADIERLADMIPWQVGDKVDKKLRKRHDTAIAKAFGVQAQEKGGLGIKGSQDYTRIAEMAQLFRKNPEWFRLRDGEAWPDLVDRISSQVTGLGTKTGSFASVWQNPAGAAVSAMDRHMAMRLFEDMFPAGTAERAAIEKEMADRWNVHIDRREALEKKLSDNKINKKKYDQESGNIAVTSDATRATDLKDILAQPAGDGFFTDVMLQKMGAGEKKLNVREGTGPNSYLRRNPRLSQGLQDTDWIVEPDKVKTASPLYRQALEVNAADAAQQGLSLFMAQWRGWDRQRRRLEPHENMFPGLEKLPRPSNDQLRAVLDAHRGTGHLDYTKENLPNAKGENEARLRPTRPTENPAGLAFFSQGPVPVPRGSQEDPAVQAAVQAWLRSGGM